jgi:hypothetical protein
MLILAIREANFHKAGEINGVAVRRWVGRKGRDDHRPSANR